MANELDNSFEPLTNEYHHNSSVLKDQHELIKITNKTPVVKDIGKIVRGDNNSNILTFEIDRYWDNEDLSTKGIQFIVKNEDGILVEPATNLQYNDEFIRFSWVMSHFVTNRDSVTVAIEFYGTIDDERNYAYKTVPFTIQIADILSSDELNVYTVSDNLYIDLLNRLIKIEYKLSGGDTSFITKMDLQTAIENIEFESEPINFITLFGGGNDIEETN